MQTVSTGGYNNWPSIGDPYWCTTFVVQNQPLARAVRPRVGTGHAELIIFVGKQNSRQHHHQAAFHPLPRPAGHGTCGTPISRLIGGSWHPFDGNGQPVAEYVQDYLCRAVAYTLYTTKCDGFRLDAVKHVPVGFFGAETGQTDDSSFAGYTGAIQAMYDYVHGYGSNVTGNGYVETDGSRNSLFNTEAARNDAMIFGEHISPAPPFVDYLQSGMRLENQPLYSQLNNAFTGGSSLAGMDGRDYQPNYSNCDGTGNYSAAQGVNFPLDQDYGFYANLGLEDAYLFMREGLPMVYSDGFNHNVLRRHPCRQLCRLSRVNSATTPSRKPCTCTTSCAWRHQPALERRQHHRLSNVTIIAKAPVRQNPGRRPLRHQHQDQFPR